MKNNTGFRVVFVGLGVILSFIGFGLLGQQGRRNTGFPLASILTAKEKSDSYRKLLLNDAKDVSQGLKDDEQNVLKRDPLISEKWGLVKTKALQAWEVSKGSKEIKVAVIDTGLDIRHPCLTDNLWVNKGEIGIDEVTKKDRSTNMVDDDKNGFIDDVHGWNFVSNSPDLTDNHGHGTHIAGIIGAHLKSGCTYSGMAPKVSVMALKYFDPKAPGTNNLKNTVAAIKYAVKMGANVINYSGGGAEYSAEEFNAIKDAEKAGILFIAAAGNFSNNTDDSEKRYYPADYGLSNIISVTAVNEKDTQVLPSSNYGSHTVDLAAPGDAIMSTLPGARYGKMTGTSQATAWVTGVAVLVMGLRTDLNFAEVKKYILTTGDEYPTLYAKTGTAKLLNSYKALTNLDLGVSVSGVKTVNTERTSNRAFSSQGDGNDREVAPSALSNGSRDEAEETGKFGRDLLKTMGIKTRNPGSADDKAPTRDPNLD